MTLPGAIRAGDPACVAPEPGVAGGDCVEVPGELWEEGVWFPGICCPACGEAGVVA